MAAHDVMEVTTMSMDVRRLRGRTPARERVTSRLAEGPSLGLGTLDGVDVDAAFTEIVMSDDDLVDLEFEALVSAEFGDPPGTGGAPHDDAHDAPPPPWPRCSLAPRPSPAARTDAARRRNRQRSPPRARGVAWYVFS
ncbi:hypothetical protein [Terrabacter sp. 2RAF25]|uniref:hypothetical protein n=1 Tax=Terrabacter sp. 2RAF25 TaxID=3232998 RepID=UPI003F9490D3